MSFTCVSMLIFTTDNDCLKKTRADIGVMRLISLALKTIGMKDMINICVGHEVDHCCQCGY